MNRPIPDRRPGARDRARRAAAAAAVAVLAAVVGFPGSAGAQSATAPRMDVRPGFDGLVRSGTVTPLTVAIEASRLFSGSIEVALQNQVSSSTLRQSLEVPGGSRKVVRILSPRADILDVRLVDRGGRVVQRAGAPNMNLLGFGESLVGVVSVAPPSARRVEIPGLPDAARVVPIPVELLDLGPEAVRALSHLVVDADAAKGLSPRQRSAVLSYAIEGGELVVAASDEPALSFLPEPWRGTGGGTLRRTRLADGAVTVALEPFAGAGWTEGGAMWSRALRPPAVDRWRADELGSWEWVNALSASGRFRRPALGWLLGFILGYVALAGPLNFIVLARLRRRELAWITVPALAIVFASGAYVIGRGVRNVALIQGAGISVVEPAGDRSTVILGVMSRSGGTERLEIPGGWLAEALASGRGGGAAGSHTVTMTRDRQVASFELPVGDIGTAVARTVSMKASSPGGTLREDAGVLSGRVENPLGAALRDARVVVGASSASVGTLGPGESTDVSLDVPQGGFSFNEGEMHLGPFSGTQGEAFLQLQHRARRSAGLGAPGRAHLVGWVDLEEAGPRLGIGKPVGTLLVLVPLGFEMTGDRVPAGAVRRALAWTDGDVQRGDEGPFEFVHQARELIVRFELPKGSAPKRLSVSLDRELGRGFFPGDLPAVEVPPGPPGAPDILPIQPNLTVDLFEPGRGTWRTVRLRDAAAEVPAAGLISEHGEVLLRMRSDFAQSIAVGAVRLGGAA